MRKILIIEDLESDFRLIERQLRLTKAQVQCRQVRSNTELADALQQEAWDVVLIDYNVPGMEFSGSLTQVRQHLPQAPVILISGHLDEEVAVEWLCQGLTDFVLKDRLSRLGPAIQRSIDDSRDRQARQRTEQALRDSETRFRAIFDGIGDAAIFTDPTRRVVMVNPAFSSVFGYSAAEVIGRTTTFLYISEADYLAQGQRRFRGDASPETPEAQSSRFEWCYRRKDGSQFWAETLATPVRDATGQLIGLLSLHHDISERRRADERLLQSAAVFSNSQEGIVITDAQHCIVSANPAFSTITGYSEAEVIGRPMSTLRSGRHDPAFYQAMRHSLASTDAWRGEIWNRRKNGEVYPQWLAINAIYDSRGLVSNYVGVFTDISHIKASEARLEHLAHFDPLTNLPNRLLVLSRIQHAIDRCARQQRRVAVLYIDLDRFKTVNDSLGHPAGDELLRLLSERLAARLRGADTLARLGGDEFMLVLEDLLRTEDVSNVARILLKLLEEPFQLGHGQEVFISASIGVSIYPDDASSVTELVQHADTAMYQAKDQGRNTFSFYTSALSQQARERLALETRLRRALDRQEFVLHYQPQVQVGNGRLIGVEALVRWQPPGEPMISPARFIPIAEETGLIRPLGAWVLHEACRQAKAWLDAGLPPLSLAVNLSGRQFQAQDMVSQVREVLQATGLPPSQLELELTESVVMQQADASIANLTALKALGVRLSVDDFGTGYSSLA
ncbi:MAG: EAL domain-containing protein, partial [Leptothrix sp. (in: b-proteobacteria)]